MPGAKGGVEALRSCPVPAALPTKELAALAALARDESYRARDDIFMEGDPPSGSAWCTATPTWPTKWRPTCWRSESSWSASPTRSSRRDRPASACRSVQISAGHDQADFERAVAAFEEVGRAHHVI